MKVRLWGREKSVGWLRPCRGHHSGQDMQEGESRPGIFYSLESGIVP